MRDSGSQAWIDVQRFRTAILQQPTKQRDRISGALRFVCCSSNLRLKRIDPGIVSPGAWSVQRSALFLGRTLGIRCPSLPAIERHSRQGSHDYYNNIGAAACCGASYHHLAWVPSTGLLIRLPHALTVRPLGTERPRDHAPTAPREGGSNPADGPGTGTLHQVGAWDAANAASNRGPHDRSRRRKQT